MILATASTETVLFAISTLVGLAGALGVAYTVFRSSSEQRLKEVDQHIINNQNLLLQQLESELSKLRTELSTERQRAETYRDSLTQKAAVDHLSELVIREEKVRHEEHEMQVMLLKDILAQLKHARGQIA